MNNYGIADVDILMKNVGGLESLDIFSDQRPPIGLIGTWTRDNTDVVAGRVM